jgi:hypothetical protein
MAAPPGFNANASLLPDPGAASAPIHIVQGGGASSNSSNSSNSSVEANSEYTEEQQWILEKYGMGSRGPLTNFPPQTKRAFLEQIDTACGHNAGESTILNSKCWAVMEVVRALIQESIRRAVDE